jgi:group I intron endonuclease
MQEIISMPREKFSGVYAIRLIDSDECYVGSSIDVYKRWYSHKYKLRYNCSHFVLQTVWNLHGEDKFEFVLLERCDPTRLAEREQYYIDNLNSRYNGNRSVTEWILTEEARKGLSVKLKARHARMSDIEKEELKEKLSESNKRWALENPEGAKSRAKNPDGSHTNAILTEQEILDIFSSPETSIEAANRYGIAQSMVSLIRNEKRWSHVERPKVSEEILEQRKQSIEKAHQGIGRSLDEEAVLEILTRLDGPEGAKWGVLTNLAKEYGVCRQMIDDIRRGKAWNHLYVRFPDLENKTKKNVKIRFEEDDVRDIKKRIRDEGDSVNLSQIARDYGVSSQTIQQIKDGKSWTHV